MRDCARSAGRVVPLFGALLLYACGGGPTANLPPTPTATPVALTTPRPTPTAVLPASVDVRDAIDALYFGSGPLVPSDGFTACAVGYEWTAFPSGAVVHVRISTTLSAPAQEAVRVAAGQWQEAVEGEVTPIVELTGEADPLPKEGEITVTVHPNPVSQGCAYERGCTSLLVRTSVIVSARALLGPSIALTNALAAFPHDAIGHGALGMCHIDAVRIGGARNSLMAGGPNTYSCAVPSDTCISIDLAPLDIEAARAIHRAGMPRGATRDDFLKAGLVNPVTSVATSARGHSIRRVRISDTDELIIIDHE
jgi:hypothetical protein